MSSKYKNKVDLENGNISKALMALALPIMGSSLVQMAYTIIDTAWVGLLGSNAVAAVATASQALWIGQGIAMVPQFGGQILTGQELGAGNIGRARIVAGETLKQGVILLIIYTFLILFFRDSIIAFFHLNNQSTINMAHEYIFIVGISMLLNGMNAVINGQFTSMGDSKTPFIFNSAGVIANIILDPVMMLGWFGFPKMGVSGAALATLISQLIVTVLYIVAMIKDEYLFTDIGLFRKLNIREFKRIFKLGLPPAFQTVGFAFIAILVTRIAVQFGDSIIAIQRVGAMIESVTWMTADGFALAMTSYTARNYGAKKEKRISEGYKVGISMMGIYGAIITVLFLLFAVPVFRIFLHEERIVLLGAVYLRIQAVSQPFMCLSSISRGAFSGIGKTKLPSILGISITALRVPLSLLLISFSHTIVMVWIVISVTTVAEGAVLTYLYIKQLRKGIKYDN